MELSKTDFIKKEQSADLDLLRLCVNEPFTVAMRKVHEEKKVKDKLGIKEEKEKRSKSSKIIGGVGFLLLVPGVLGVAFQAFKNGLKESWNPVFGIMSTLGILLTEASNFENSFTKGILKYLGSFMKTK